ncbi:hypothetical protein FKM82_017289 [Ascaphus truei]
MYIVRYHPAEQHSEVSQQNDVLTDTKCDPSADRNVGRTSECCLCAALRDGNVLYTSPMGLAPGFFFFIS